MLIALPVLRRVTVGMASGSSPLQAARGLVTNRLVNEKSPYLLQHAHNPVDWYPWGEEAFVRAREAGRPIFLSVGYSTCHWCHVMERESFESPQIGELLNRSFVSIKVDREERPDVDRVYMTFVQATQGGGGWPMSVFLTPDLKPFMGGTYFPPQDSFGRPGFATILKTIADQWSSDKERIVQQGSNIMEALSKAVSAGPSSQAGGLPAAGCIQRGYQTLEQRFDSKYGGFGSAPKFPQPVILGFLLGMYARYPASAMGERALEMTLATLRAMAAGGMHDHVGQGFHRYSTDAYWHVPHFEKMLYDQGQLATVYTAAYQITKDEFFADTVRDILLYVSRDLSDKEGGFYSAEDADSFPSSEGDECKKEGAFCVWTWEAVHALLATPLPSSDAGRTTAHLFCFHYDVRKEGNVSPHQDPHKELTGQNVLIVRGSLEKTAAEFKLEASQARQLLAECRELLFSERLKRPKPHRDDKILTAWNGLMISGFARAAQVLQDSAHLDRAVAAAHFIKQHLYKAETGVLVRNGYRDSNGELGIGSVNGFADDYAFLVQGLLDLFEASQDCQWLQWASQLQDKMTDLFWDKENGGYFGVTSDDPSILLRLKEDQDGAEPSCNSVTAMNLLRLSSFLDKRYSPSAEDVITSFSAMLSEHPVALPAMLQAFVRQSQPPKQVIIAGEMGSPDTKALLEVVNSFYLPHSILVVHSPGAESFTSSHLKVLHSITTVDGKACAYACENYTCSVPVTDPEKLRRRINPKKLI